MGEKMARLEPEIYRNTSGENSFVIRNEKLEAGPGRCVHGRSPYSGEAVKTIPQEIIRYNDGGVSPHANLVLHRNARDVS